MELDTSTLMMIFFILTLVISIWKLYVFLPNHSLPDDDTTKEAQDELLNIIKKHVNKDNKNSKQLLQMIKDDEDFDKEHFWRFNQNKLNQLLRKLEV